MQFCQPARITGTRTGVFTAQIFNNDPVSLYILMVTSLTFLKSQASVCSVKMSVDYCS